MRLLLTLLSFLLVTACGPHIKLRRDVFQGKPLWEPTAIAGSARSVAAAKTLTANDAPGLTYVAQQVLGQGTDLTSKRGEVARSTPKGLRLADKYAADSNPLPDNIAKLPVTKAVVEAARAACLGETLKEVSLPACAFRKFGEEMRRASVAIYQGDAPPERLEKLRAFMDGGKLTWEGVAFAYFSAYYSGNFVDRTGGKLSKPSIGMKIPNETITSALTVGMEALYDYVLASCADQVPNPIVFAGTADKPTFETKDENEPTLVNVLRHVYQKTSPTVPVVDGVLELLIDDTSTQPGISKLKLQLVRTLSGYASDAGSTLADMIVRSIGGAGGAFVLFGKISIGDNDTLSKVIQTAVDVTARRTTEAAVASYLYPRSASDGGPLDPLLKPSAYRDRSL